MCRSVEFDHCGPGVAQSCLRVVTLLAAVTLVCLGCAQAQESKVETELGVHRLEEETTSPYDAFAYVNRVPTEMRKGESPVDFAGMVLLSRLANQEGRIEVKILEGFNRSAYYGYKAFIRAWPEEDVGTGNCVVCHTPPTFTNGKKYIVDPSGAAKVTPSLRNLKDSGKDIEAIIQQKVKMAEMARDGGAENIDEAYKLMKLSESEVKDIVQFIGSLNEVPKEGFRDLILKSKVLDTTDVFN